MSKAPIAWAGSLLLIVLVFQVTVLPDTLDMRSLSRVVNAIALACFVLAGGYTLLSGRAAKAPPTYVLAMLLVIAGISINVGRGLSSGSLGAAGALLASTAAISVPFMRSFDIKRSWRVF